MAWGFAALAGATIIGSIIQDRAHSRATRERRSAASDFREDQAKMLQRITGALEKMGEEYEPFIDSALTTFKQLNEDIQSGRYSMENFESDFLDPTKYEGFTFDQTIPPISGV